MNIDYEDCSLDELFEYCDSYREKDGFCWKSSSCSGPTQGGIKPDYDWLVADDKELTHDVYRGKCGCFFVRKV